MISVCILINGQPIMARSAVNMAGKMPSGEEGKTPYQVDSGEVIYHHRSDGAVELAKLMLETIKEVKP